MTNIYNEICKYLFDNLWILKSLMNQSFSKIEIEEEEDLFTNNMVFLKNTQNELILSFLSYDDSTDLILFCSKNGNDKRFFIIDKDDEEYGLYGGDINNWINLNHINKAAFLFMYENVRSLLICPENSNENIDQTIKEIFISFIKWKYENS